MTTSRLSDCFWCVITSLVLAVFFQSDVRVRYHQVYCIVLVMHPARDNRSVTNRTLSLAPHLLLVYVCTVRDLTRIEVHA